MNATSVKMDNNFRSFKRLCKKIIKGKAFQKDEFGTGLFDLTLRGAIRKQQNRPEGSNNVPAKLLLSPVDGNRASKHATTRIFIGSEDAQHRAERVLLWSILKHRDPEKYYEVRIMKDLEGFDRKYWKTGFTGYRYAIPEFAGFEGRAIYNDVDQIYLDDPAKLQAENMCGAAVLALESRDTSVMVMNCAELKNVWTIAAIQSSPERKIHASMLGHVRRKLLIGDLPVYWNARDHEYDEHSSKLLHYTTLHMQPWRPFRKDLRYRENPHGKLWQELENEADQRGFALEWKTQPGRSYIDMEGFYELENIAST